MFCEKCHTDNPNGTKFCVNCGNPLESSTPDNSQNNVYQAQNQYQSYQPYQPYQPYPQQDVNYQPKADNENEHMTIGGWIGVFCINLIPCVGSLVYLIMMFVWAFGSTPKKSLKTFAQAQLLIMAILLVLGIITFAILFSAGIFAANSYSSYGYY